jgi:hypothetical protein
MNKRPKSREETPKEGSDRARPYRTATICGRAAQNASVFGCFSAQYGTGWQIGNTPVIRIFVKFYQMVTRCVDLARTALQCWYTKNSQLRDGQTNQKSTLKRSPAESRFESMFRKTAANNPPMTVRGGPDWVRQEADILLYR